jgi:DNA-binding transcriptional regulator GbsR (MarR family)
VAEETSVTGAGQPGAEPKGPDREALLRYIERFASLLISLGVPPMPARVFAALLITDSGRLTAAELAGTLQVSRAAISDGVRYLTQLGLVDREREPGSRRDYYRMPDDVWVKMISLRDQTLVRWSGLLREGIDLIGAGTPAGARMAEHAAYVEFVSKELPGVLQRWEEYKAGLPGNGY